VDHRDVACRIGSDQRAGKLLSVCESDGELGAPLDDVIVGDDVALGVEHDARAEAVGGLDDHDRRADVADDTDEVVLQRRGDCG
jgi:hypothetical protein